MAGWSLAVFLVAVSGSLALAEHRLTFLENVRGENTRIVSGWEAEEGEIPYQISLRIVSQVGGVSACGGTIIHNEWALTAAHCTALRVSIVIRAGTVNLTRPESMFETTTYFNHPLYIEALQSVVQPHDISLIYFNRFIEFTPRTQPIRLQSSVDMDKDYNNIRLQASGWGRTWTQGMSPENLNWVYLRGVSNAFCRNAFGGSSIIVSSTICARAYNVSSQSTCQGDSGGPLVVVDEDGRLTQVGISSFVSGSGCHTDIPAGFIRPGHYHYWIYEVTGINFDWVPEPPTTAAPQTEEPEAETTTSKKPDTEAPVTKPETEATTTKEPKTDAPTTKEPEPEETTTKEPEVETTTTQKPETDAPTTKETEPEPEVTTTREPEIETTTTQKPETDAPTTKETEPEPEVTTTKEPEIETTTTQKPETNAPTTKETEPEPQVTTTKEPEIETTTTQKPETDAPSTKETEPEPEVTTTKEPEIETTTTQKPESEESSSSKEEESSSKEEESSSSSVEQ